jgi:hypothetical protein
VHVPGVRGYSVLEALKVQKPAARTFWAGIIGIIFTLLCCPAMAGVALLGSSIGVEGADSLSSTVLTFSTCVFFVVLAIAAILVVTGRPRRLL